MSSRERIALGLMLAQDGQSLACVQRSENAVLFPYSLCFFVIESKVFPVLLA